MNDAIGASSSSRSRGRRTTFALALRNVTGAAFLVAGIVSIVACSLSALLVVSGAKLVITSSIPRGLYAREPGAIERDVVVGGCVPRAVATKLVRVARTERGPCPGGVLPFFKVVAAVAGDKVAVSASDVSINGVVWPWSGSRFTALDSLRGSSRTTSYVVSNGDVLLLGLNPDSYDGRYFGPTPLAALARYRPLLVESTPYASALERILADRQRASDDGTEAI